MDIDKLKASIVDALSQDMGLDRTNLSDATELQIAGQNARLTIRLIRKDKRAIGCDFKIDEIQSTHKTLAKNYSKYLLESFGNKKE
jgi:hypothetical protein